MPLLRVAPTSALFLALLFGPTACAPLADADAPTSSDAPCVTHDDCELRTTERGPRSLLCGNRGTGWNDSTNKSAAACGPMTNMSPNIPEPVLLCFHGTCVPVGKDY